VPTITFVQCWNFKSAPYSVFIWGAELIPIAAQSFIFAQLGLALETGPRGCSRPPWPAGPLRSKISARPLPSLPTPFFS
jgi:hypothetical protein